MTLVKISGFLGLLLATTFLGLSKSITLKNRCTRLELVCIALNKLAQYIRNGSGEIGELLRLSFGGEILTFSGEAFDFNTEYLKAEDITLFNRLLKEMGMADRQTEYERALLYGELFNKQLRLAEEENAKLFKLYTSMGFLGGLAICIFLV